VSKEYLPWRVLVNTIPTPIAKLARKAVPSGCAVKVEGRDMLGRQ
jgi:hypothetical protein